MPPTPSSVPAQQPIGLIGLGLMGTAIASRLLQKGQPVLGFDLQAGAKERAAHLGTRIAGHSGEVFDSCSLILLSLPSHHEVALLIEENRPHLRKGLLLADTSTGDPVHAESFASQLQSIGVGYADATVSGHSEQLARGQAVFLVGALPNDFGRLEQVLLLLAEKVIRVGEPGAGSRMKLVSNLVLGLNRAALAEGLAYAQSQDLDLTLVLRILKESMAYSRIMDTKGDKMIQGDFRPQARLSQHLKDVDLMLENSRQHRVWLPLTSTHRDLLAQAVLEGMGDWDNSALFELLRKCPTEDRQG